ncbi:hypothetical protein PLESTM_001031300 [Pleodorina starrii]|nr:hypothetical protein PLESTM_001031300 [Pleodorina starrii]
MGVDKSLSRLVAPQQEKAAVEKRKPYNADGRENVPPRRSNRLQGDTAVVTGLEYDDDQEYEDSEEEIEEVQDGNTKVTEAPHAVWSAGQEAILVELGCDRATSAFKVLEELAKLNNINIGLECKEDIEAWIANSVVMVSVGLRHSRFANTAVLSSMLTPTVRSSLEAGGMPTGDIESLQKALSGEAGPGNGKMSLGSAPSSAAAKGKCNAATRRSGRMLSRIMTGLIEAFGQENLASIEAYKAVVDKVGIIRGLVNRMGLKMLVFFSAVKMLHMPPASTMEEVVTRLEKSAVKKARNNDTIARTEGQNRSGRVTQVSVEWTPKGARFCQEVV